MTRFFAWPNFNLASKSFPSPIYGKAQFQQNPHRSAKPELPPSKSDHQYLIRFFTLHYPPGNQVITRPCLQQEPWKVELVRRPRDPVFPLTSFPSTDPHPAPWLSITTCPHSIQSWAPLPPLQDPAAEIPILSPWSWINFPLQCFSKCYWILCFFNTSTIINTRGSRELQSDSRISEA